MATNDEATVKPGSPVNCLVRSGPRRLKEEPPDGGLRSNTHNSRHLRLGMLFDMLYLSKNTGYNDEKQFVYDLGKRLLENCDCADIRSYNFDIRKELEKLHLIPKTVDKVGLMAALERHEAMVKRFCE